MSFVYISDKMSQTLTRAGELQQTADGVVVELLGWLGGGSKGLPVRESQAAEFDPNSLEVQIFREPLIHYASTSIQVSRIRSVRQALIKGSSLVDSI